jgi:16S rRNA (uracil1498-N3)-methyltransferase
MRLTRCFAPPPLRCGAEMLLPAHSAAHLQRVLRARTGALLTLFDGCGGEFDATIVQIDRRGVRVRISAHHAVERESPLAVTLLQALARGERMDLIVQKATELAVAAIVAFAGERSVVRLTADALARRGEHWRAIAISACEQCGRNRIPSIRIAADLGAACGAAPADGQRLLLSPQAAHSLPAALGQAAAVTLLIGPEGGFSVDELATAEHHGFIAARLGPRVLRAETAPLAALATIQALAGDFGP